MDPIIHGLGMSPIYEEGGNGARPGSGRFKQRSQSQTTSTTKYSTLGSYGGVGSGSSGGGGGGGSEFERSGSGSTKSVAKSRSPLSRLWQMRRRSFSQFELSSAGTEDSPERETGTPAFGNGTYYASNHDLRSPSPDHDHDTSTSGAGLYPLIADSFWGSESDISASSSPFKRKVMRNGHILYEYTLWL
jgi:hypothetical protein